MRHQDADGGQQELYADRAVAEADLGEFPEWDHAIGYHCISYQNIRGE
jgi:hypothetical protein